MPANGGCAKRDVMCADPSPLLTEDQCLLPPQHRERGAVLPSGLGVSGGDVGVRRQRGQSQGIWSFTPADGVPGAAQGVSPSCPCSGQRGWPCGPSCSSCPMLWISPHKTFSCPLLPDSACLGPGVRRERVKDPMYKKGLRDRDASMPPEITSAH